MPVPRIYHVKKRPDGVNVLERLKEVDVYNVDDYPVVQSRELEGRKSVLVGGSIASPHGMGLMEDEVQSHIQKLPAGSLLLKGSLDGKIQDAKGYLVLKKLDVDTLELPPFNDPPRNRNPPSPESQGHINVSFSPGRPVNVNMDSGLDLTGYEPGSLSNLERSWLSEVSQEHYRKNPGLKEENQLFEYLKTAKNMDGLADNLKGYPLYQHIMLLDAMDAVVNRTGVGPGTSAKKEFLNHIAWGLNPAAVSRLTLTRISRQYKNFYGGVSNEVAGDIGRLNRFLDAQDPEEMFRTAQVMHRQDKKRVRVFAGIAMRETGIDIEQRMILELREGKRGLGKRFWQTFSGQGMLPLDDEEKAVVKSFSGRFPESLDTSGAFRNLRKILLLNTRKDVVDGLAILPENEKDPLWNLSFQVEQSLREEQGGITETQYRFFNKIREALSPHKK